jgi:hypothetical protein
MSLNGSGTYSLPAGNPVVTGTTISSTTHNNTMTDIATAISTAIFKDGQQTITANIPFATYRITSLGDATAAQDAITAKQVQNSTTTTLSSVSGTNTVTGSATPTPSAYATGQSFEFIPAVTNTGATTLNVSSLGAKNVFANGAACVGGELVANVPVRVKYDGTQFNILGANFFQNNTSDLAPDKTADYVPSYDASAKLYKRIILQELPLPRSYLAGGTLSNGTDATNDIDVTAGEARDSTNVVNIRWSALTKQLDAAWAAGTAAGMLDTGSIADTTYHIYAIRKDSDGTGDILASTSASSPTMPSGYTYFRRIGSILRESSSIVAFSQNGDEFLRKATANSISVTNLDTTAVLYPLAVPLGVKVNALFTAAVTSASVGVIVYFSSPDQNDETGSAAAGRVSSGVPTINRHQGAHYNVRTDTSAQIRAVADTASTTVEAAVYGWIDRRGRDA